MSWTEERVSVLKKLWAEGHSASQIAKQLGGVTRNAVIGKVHRLGLSGRATPCANGRLGIQPIRNSLSADANLIAVHTVPNMRKWRSSPHANGTAAKAPMIMSAVLPAKPGTHSYG